jgi:predicted membrane channel-forming protein YqfA (hemolysin III family)
MPAPTPVRSPLPEAWDDLLGMLLSCLCAVHCAATVLFVSTLTTVGLAGMADPRVERAMLLVAMVVGGIVLGHGAVAHRRLRPLVPFLLGVLALVVVRPRLPEGSQWELAAVLVGALGIVGAHAMSYRSRRRCASHAGLP